MVLHFEKIAAYPADPDRPRRYKEARKLIIKEELGREN